MLLLVWMCHIGHYTTCGMNHTDTINLAGKWNFSLPYAPDSIAGNGTISLPGTLDTNGVGIPVPVSSSTQQLARRVSFTGEAIYSREINIPQDWNGKQIFLILERLRPAAISIDGQFAGMKNLISAPHIYELTDFLTPGQHILSITVDNGRSIPATVRLNSHSCSESTQTNWNGILGEMILTTSTPSISNRVNKKNSLTVNGRQFFKNGEPEFLRGTVDACVRPLTAHPPMDKETWRKYFETLRNFGLNHVRFHTWCPPEAAFEVADEMNFILQPELPLWGEIDTEQEQLLGFLEEELDAIVSAYGHHPSFAMLSLGNELWGDTNIMKQLADRARALKPDLLVNFGSNVYLGSNGRMDGEDFYTASRVGNSYDIDHLLRRYFPASDLPGGGPANAGSPDFSENYTLATQLTPVPSISHEIGQYQSYPDFAESDAYTGVLRADNIRALEEKTRETGLLPYAEAMREASGKWAVKLYKAEVEKALRTPGMGGFHIQALQDYPGQGTATVGLINTFGEKKDFVSTEEWIQSCSDKTLLAALPGVCLEAGSQIEIPVMTANYSGHPLKSERILWSTDFDEGLLVCDGKTGLRESGIIKLNLPRLESPRKIELSLRLPEDSVTNSYSLWIYPQLSDKTYKKFILTSSLDEALRSLAEGRRVVLCADSATTAAASLDALFPTDFWNRSMYASLCESLNKKPSPGTLGLLISNPSHPVFNFFPTDNHTDWQWQSVVKASRPLVINRLPSTFDPLVRVIDNPDRSLRLALMMEFKVDKGAILVISADLEKLRDTLEGRWLLESMCSYVASKKFKPSVALTPRQLKTLLTRPL